MPGVTLEEGGQSWVTSCRAFLQKGEAGPDAPRSPGLGRPTAEVSGGPPCVRRRPAQERAGFLPEALGPEVGAQQKEQVGADTRGPQTRSTTCSRQARRRPEPVAPLLPQPAEKGAENPSAHARADVWTWLVCLPARGLLPPGGSRGTKSKGWLATGQQLLVDTCSPLQLQRPTAAPWTRECGPSAGGTQREDSTAPCSRCLPPRPLS